MSEIDLSIRFGLSLALGLFLGLERQLSHNVSLLPDRLKSTPDDAALDAGEDRSLDSSERHFAGVRTFSLISLLGAISLYIGQSLGMEWMFVVVFGALALLLIASNVLWHLSGTTGTTTYITAMLAFLIGGLCMQGMFLLAVSVTVSIAFILAIKKWINRMIVRIEPEDISATLKFAIITAIVLPLLPDRNFGWGDWQYLNPYKIWLMVVLISAINFVSYVLMKAIGEESGIGLTGLIGGLISSTAITLGFARRSVAEPELSTSLTMGVILSWSVMVVRIVALVVLLRPELIGGLTISLTMLLLPGLIYAFYLWKSDRETAQTTIAKKRPNPFELGEAIKFGLLFGGVTFIAHVARDLFGESGVYAASALSALTDVDPIVLSMAELAGQNGGFGPVAVRAILIAAFTNTVTKGVMVLALAHPTMKKRMAPALVLYAAGALVAFFVA
jgi:uncharacterized membrane protein (DUF4010 family)